jgi:hypothetical protein
MWSISFVGTEAESCIVKSVPANAPDFYVFQVVEFLGWIDLAGLLVP